MQCYVSIKGWKDKFCSAIRIKKKKPAKQYVLKSAYMWSTRFYIFVSVCGIEKHCGSSPSASKGEFSYMPVLLCYVEVLKEL